MIMTVTTFGTGRYIKVTSAFSALELFIPSNRALGWIKILATLPAIIAFVARAVLVWRDTTIDRIILDGKLMSYDEYMAPCAPARNDD